MPAAEFHDLYEPGLMSPPPPPPHLPLPSSSRISAELFDAPYMPPPHVPLASSRPASARSSSVAESDRAALNAALNANDSLSSLTAQQSSLHRSSLHRSVRQSSSTPNNLASHTLASYMPAVSTPSRLPPHASSTKHTLLAVASRSGGFGDILQDSSLISMGLSRPAGTFDTLPSIGKPGSGSSSNLGNELAVLGPYLRGAAQRADAASCSSNSSSASGPRRCMMELSEFVPTKRMLQLGPTDAAKRMSSMESAAAMGHGRRSPATKNITMHQLRTSMLSNSMQAVPCTKGAIILAPDLPLPNNNVLSSRQSRRAAAFTKLQHNSSSRSFSRSMRGPMIEGRGPIAEGCRSSDDDGPSAVVDSAPGAPQACLEGACSCADVGGPGDAAGAHASWGIAGWNAVKWPIFGLPAACRRSSSNCILTCSSLPSLFVFQI